MVFNNLLITIFEVFFHTFSSKRGRVVFYGKNVLTLVGFGGVRCRDFGLGSKEIEFKVNLGRKIK